MNLAVLERYGPRMLEGLLVTLELVALSIALGFCLAVVIAAGRLSRHRVLRWLASGYCLLFRGTPLIAQVFLIYYGLGQFRDGLEAVGLWWFFREPFNCVVFTFTLNTAAYQAEIYRGAVQAIPRGQWEAGDALGLSRLATFRKIVAPQAALIALRPFGNEIVLMIKGSAIASVVTVYDLFGATELAFSRTFAFEVYLWAAVLYLLMVETLRRVWDRLERRLTRHLAPATGGAAPVAPGAPAAV